LEKGEKKEEEQPSRATSGQKAELTSEQAKQSGGSGHGRGKIEAVHSVGGKRYDGRLSVEKNQKEVIDRHVQH